MRRLTFIAAGMLLGAWTALPGPLWGIFSTVAKVSIVASATTGGPVGPPPPKGPPAGGPVTPSLSILTPAMPATALFGKNAVIPVQVTSPDGSINLNNLTLSVMFQMFDSGTPPVPLTAPSNSAVIPLSSDPANPAAKKGSAVIPESALQPLQNGGQLYYVFRVEPAGVPMIFNIAGLKAPTPGDLASLLSTSSYHTKVAREVCSPVGPEGGNVIAPDLYIGDGQTKVHLPENAVAAHGTLCIKENDTSGWPPGPGGAQPAVVFTFTPQGAGELEKTATLVLSYPSDTDGSPLNLHANPSDLAIYWLGPEGSWHALAQPQVDTTLHTVTALTSHFSTYALFAAGPPASSALRPPQRIITPNGDKNNDVAVFGVGIDSVKIFNIRGRRIKTIAGPSPIWDGSNDSGGIVESGVYIYQFTSNGDRISGVIAVAK